MVRHTTLLHEGNSNIIETTENLEQKSKPFLMFSIGVITHQELIARNQVISTVEDFGGLNITSVRSYNIAGELVFITDANHQATNSFYDIRGRKTQ